MNKNLRIAEKCYNCATANEKRATLARADEPQDLQKNNDILPQDKSSSLQLKQAEGQAKRETRKQSFPSIILILYKAAKDLQNKAKKDIAIYFNSGEFDPGSG